MDDTTRHTMERWEALARAGVQYARPLLDLDADSARARVDRRGLLGELAGKDVLCLAGGGGQDAPAFALLGATVTTLDLTEAQLEGDRHAARHYGLDWTVLQGDMRDLSRFPDRSFDIVCHAHSITFVPDPRPVFREAARVLRPGGVYTTHFCNPFLHGVADSGWDGRGYPIRQPYVDGAEVHSDEACWGIRREDGSVARVEGPREFRHALGTVVNTVIASGLTLLGLWEDPPGDRSAPPGSWEHACAYAPPFLELWTRRTA